MSALQSLHFLILALCCPLSHLQTYAQPVRQVSHIKDSKFEIEQILQGRPLLDQQYPFHATLFYFARWYLDPDYFLRHLKRSHPDVRMKGGLTVRYKMYNTDLSHEEVKAVMYEFCFHMIYEMWRQDTLRTSLSFALRYRQYRLHDLSDMEVRQNLITLGSPSSSLFAGSPNTGSQDSAFNQSSDNGTYQRSQTTFVNMSSVETEGNFSLDTRIGDTRVEITAGKRRDANLRYKDIIYLLAATIFYLSSGNAPLSLWSHTCVTATGCSGQLEIAPVVFNTKKGDWQRIIAKGIMSSLDQIGELSFPVSSLSIRLRSVTGEYHDEPESDIHITQKPLAPSGSAQSGSECSNITPPPTKFTRPPTDVENPDFPDEVTQL